MTNYKELRINNTYLMVKKRGKLMGKYVGKYIKYDIQLANFKPVFSGKVRWLGEDDFRYMNEFWNMSLETWNGAKEAGYTYCSIIEDDKIVSVAAFWKYSQDRWEAAAVNTRNGFENRGLAKQVVSFVTNYILIQNKIPTLTTREDNIPMRKIAEALGFKQKER